MVISSYFKFNCLLTFHISDLHDFKNRKQYIFFIFEGSLIFFSIGVLMDISIFIKALSLILTTI